MRLPPPRAGRRWRYQSSGRWTVTSTLATQLARLCMRSQQRPAPRHQAAFRAAPEPRSATSLLRRLRERSGSKGMAAEAGRRRGGTFAGLETRRQAPLGDRDVAPVALAPRNLCNNGLSGPRCVFSFPLLLSPHRPCRRGQVRRLRRGGGRGHAARRRARHASRVLLAARRVAAEGGAERLDLRPGGWPR